MALDSRAGAAHAPFMSNDINDTDLDFAMLTPPARPGPCKAATAPEVDQVEARLERERTAGEWAKHFQEMGFQVMPTAVEIRHGSGKVKV
jgi:hypothetical protein